MAKFVKAIDGPGTSVTYIEESGKKFLFSGGNRNWRNNNPGNLVPGKISKRNGAIGVAGGFAVFPDVVSGHRALLDSLRATYGNKSLEEMIKNYAPEHENDTASYLRFLRKRTGVQDNRKINEFTSDQFEKLWRAIVDREGKERPKVSEITDGKKKITEVQKDKKGTIVRYFVNGFGWLKKSDAIALVIQGKIDAVVATSRSGSTYLRTRPDPLAENLEDMG